MRWHHEHFEKGDASKGFAEADEIIDETYEFPMIYHYTMEPHTTVARVTREGITLWTSSAHPFLVRAELAHMFGYSHSKVEVIVPYVGGAFGGKSYFKIEPMVVAMARKTGGRPVRVAQSASESMLTIRRHSATCRIRTGVKRDGTLIAREAEVLMDTGAYADNGPRVAKRAASRIHGPYKINHCKVDILAVYTNTVPAGSMRSADGTHGYNRTAVGDRSFGISLEESPQGRRRAESRRPTYRRRFVHGGEDRCPQYGLGKSEKKSRPRSGHRRWCIGFRSDAGIGRAGSSAR